MSEQDVEFLMTDSLRDLRLARRFLDEGLYPKSINESYYAAFYAGRACLISLGITSKSHRSVQAGIDMAVDDGSTPLSMSNTVLNCVWLFGRRHSPNPG